MRRVGAGIDVNVLGTATHGDNTFEEQRRAINDAGATAVRPRELGIDTQNVLMVRCAMM